MATIIYRAFSACLSCFPHSWKLEIRKKMTGFLFIYILVESWECKKYKSVVHILLSLSSAWDGAHCHVLQLNAGMFHVPVNFKRKKVLKSSNMNLRWEKFESFHHFLKCFFWIFNKTFKLLQNFSLPFSWTWIFSSYFFLFHRNKSSTN